MYDYKVVIPCAGLGSRLSELTNHINKALVPIAHRPAISYIMDKFDSDIEIVIILGYKKKGLQEFLEMVYPEYNFTFVEVDKYQGKGSGLGYSLLSAKKYLQSPFIFISNDTIILDEIPTPQKMKGLKNWIGYADVQSNNIYRSLSVKDGKVSGLYEKSIHPDYPAYIGLCGITDHETFWDIMEDNKDSGSIEIGESFALQTMIDMKMDFEGIEFQWYDTGTKKGLDHVNEHFKWEDEPRILEKDKETIWFVDDKVIKFAVDTNFIKNRVKRAKMLQPFVPEVKDSSDNMYMYKYINGQMLSNGITTESFKYFLELMDKFWIHQYVDIKDICKKFYKDKTFIRINEYFDKFNNYDSDKEIVNGVKMPSIMEMLRQVDWDTICDGIAVNFHGDLHFENIVMTNSDNDNVPPFVLLDWRQDFGGKLEYGDLYYDLGKLYHGLIISHDIIDKNFYTFDRKMNEVKYDFYRKNINIDCETIFIEYLKAKGYDINKVKIITAFIFLNMSPLHHYPYSHLLFYLGKTLLYNMEILNE